MNFDNKSRLAKPLLFLFLATFLIRLPGAVLPPAEYIYELTETSTTRE